MVKHTQTISRQQRKNGLSVFDRFVGLELRGLIALHHKTGSEIKCPNNTPLVSSFTFFIFEQNMLS